MWVHSEQTKQVAVRLAQSKLKKVAIEVFNCALLDQKVSLLQTGHLNWYPLISTVFDSVFLNNFIILGFG
jgi:hypothetical protein